MPGGRRNPLAPSRIVEAIASAAKAKGDLPPIPKDLEHMKLGDTPFFDLQIQVKFPKPAVIQRCTEYHNSLLGHRDCLKWM